MRLSENLSVSDAKMAELKGMKKEQVIKWINSKNLFKGLATKTANKKTEEIYEKIKSWGSKKEAPKPNTPKNTSSNGGSDTKGQGDTTAQKS